MYRLIIHAEGSIDEAKVKPETAEAIKTQIKQLSPDAAVSVSFKKEE